MTKRNSFIESTKETDERLEALKQLYPEIFSDGKINLDAFKDVTGTSDLPDGQDKTPGYYGLYWPGKRAAKQLARKEAEGTLEPVPGDGVNEDTTHNIYIEGDNLEVLRILKQSYKGRVKMIYIDPPYNTGEDFIYPDNYKMPVEEYLKITGQADEGGKKLVTNLKSNGSFHTNWLNMMYPRLQLARELLTEDGVIFISIDDNEQANLKLLCDDVFGEENFVAKFDWRKKTGANDAKDIAVVTETILLYSKNHLITLEKNIWNRDEDSINTDRYKFSDEYVNERGKFYYDTLDRGGLQYSDSMNFGIKAPDGGIIFPNGRSEFINDGWIWKWGKEKVEWGIKNGFLEFVKSNKSKGSEYTIKYKVYQNVDNEGNIRESAGRAYMNLITEPINQIGNQEMKNIFDNKTPFSNPKPTGLINYLFNTIKSDDSIILDFFSGSATTAHAVMQLNKEDNGNRKYIMVQLPHKCDDNSDAAKNGYSNICEIGKERIRRSGKQILEEAKSNKDMFSEDYQLDIGFKVYRLQNSNFLKYTPVEGQNENSQNKLFEEFEKNQIPLVEGWKAENVLTEIILKQGFALDCTKEKVDSFKKNTIWKITDSADAVSKKIKLYVCLDNSIEEETIKNLTLNDDEKFICLDAAIDDSAYARLADKGRIETI